MSRRRLIALTGGIGSGKSVVAGMLSAMGYPVYDCDSRAKSLMDKSDVIKREIVQRVSDSAIGTDGLIDRKKLAETVFADKDRLRALNEIVHGAVRRDISDWVDSCRQNVCWIESAIIYESGIDRMVDEVWAVEAPEEVRVVRVMSRNSLSREAVVARIQAQAPPDGRVLHPLTHVIVNDGIRAVLPQVLELLNRLIIEN
ncbi:MAG: dephospho-CoA kinase [Muribaculum sp.]|nr:dephospho-CoA kinase [Muribaculum sp.]